jgi:hypothetical protein
MESELSEISFRLLSHLRSEHNEGQITEEPIWQDVMQSLADVTPRGSSLPAAS